MKAIVLQVTAAPGCVFAPGSAAWRHGVMQKESQTNDPKGEAPDDVTVSTSRRKSSISGDAHTTARAPEIGG
jgi:hypothetical protein